MKKGTNDSDVIYNKLVTVDSKWYVQKILWTYVFMVGNSSLKKIFGKHDWKKCTFSSSVFGRKEKNR